MATQTPSVRGIPADDITPQTLHFGNIPIRTFARNGQTWFLARDVCAALGIARHKAATQPLDAKLRCTIRLDTGKSGRKHAIAINASGLSALIQPCPRVQGRRLLRWVDRMAGEQMPPLAATQPATAPSAPQPFRRICTYDDLSFTLRNAEGERIQWFVPPRINSWHEHYGIGEIWFSEVVELARCNPEQAYDAMRFAGPEMSRYWLQGHPDGFFASMARWALAGILANRREPELPFDLPCLGHAPLEGLDSMRAAAAPPCPLPAAVQQAIDQQAWQEAAECQRHYYERRRKDLMARHH